ncbi:DUF4192 domain-containing protein [Knoellia locipacati]|uniref:DUF4192 domain-containing protein n=1 Tax=Knoellia locipacati TaxID=882824 RepID=UPI00384CCABF
MTSVKISTTDELLALLPHQLGYRLEQCVAVVLVTDRIVGPVARVDLPPEKDVRGTADHFLQSLLRIEPQMALLVGHDTVAGESRSLLRALHRGLLHAGVGIIDHVVVRDGRWWGWCCRPADELDGLLADHVDGHPMPDDAAVPAVAEFIARGSAPLASRSELGALVLEDAAVSEGVGDALSDLWDAFCDDVDPDGLLELGFDAAEPELDDDVEDDDAEPDGEDDSAADGLDEVRLRVRDRLASVDRVPDLWARVLAPPGERGDTFAVSDRELALMACSLVDKQWRDALVAWMSPVMFPLDEVDGGSRELLRTHAVAGPALTCEQSQAVLRRLLGLGARIPDTWPHEAAAVCTMTACVAWGVGDGSIAGDAVTRALRVEPHYRLAELLSQMIEVQLRPRRPWPGLAA